MHFAAENVLQKGGGVDTLRFNKEPVFCKSFAEVMQHQREWNEKVKTFFHPCVPGQTRLRIALVQTNKPVWGHTQHIGHEKVFEGLYKSYSLQISGITINRDGKSEYWPFSCIDSIEKL